MIWNIWSTLLVCVGDILETIGKYRLLWVNIQSMEKMLVEEIFYLHYQKLHSLSGWNSTGKHYYLLVGSLGCILFDFRWILYCASSLNATLINHDRDGKLLLLSVFSTFRLIFLFYAYSDVVEMASYAPLFVNDNSYRWLLYQTMIFSHFLYAFVVFLFVCVPCYYNYGIICK